MAARSSAPLRGARRGRLACRGRRAARAPRAGAAPAAGGRQGPAPRPALPRDSAADAAQGPGGSRAYGLADPAALGETEPQSYRAAGAAFQGE